MIDEVDSYNCFLMACGLSADRRPFELRGATIGYPLQILCDMQQPKKPEGVLLDGMNGKRPVTLEEFEESNL